MPLLTITQPTAFKKTTAQSSSLAPSDKVSLSAGDTLEVDHAFPVGNHVWVKCRQAIAPFGTVGYFFQPHVSVETTEIRAVWLTNIDSDVLFSTANLEAALQKLHTLGVNTLYPAVWQRGYTLYPSPVADAFLGAAITPDAHFAQRDMLAELLAIARPLGFRVIPWFEYGLMTPPASPIDVQHSELILQDNKGNKIRTKRTDNKPDFNVWMNPCHPKVQQFMADLIADVVKRYDIDGIQIDDHFGLPIELGYDPFSRQLYRNENPGQVYPRNHDSQAWRTWGTAKVTDLLRTIHTAVKGIRTDCTLSISPNPLGFSREHYLADWQTWEQQGLVDELAIQVYRNDTPSFVNELRKPEVIAAAARIPVTIGLLSGLANQPVSATFLAQQTQSVREHNLAGVAFFFYETLLHTQLRPTKVSRSDDDLLSIFA